MRATSSADSSPPAAAALSRLGPEYRFDTEFLVEPGPTDRVRTLWVRGKGDPSITTERLHAMASELVHLGQAVIHFGGTIEYFIHTTFNVPTMSEAFKYAAYDGLRQVGR